MPCGINDKIDINTKSRKVDFEYFRIKKFSFFSFMQNLLRMYNSVNSKKKKKIVITL